MIKLVTQFDRPQMRASVATPTCGCCCCCCCCCVVTLISTTTITARSLGKAVEKGYREDPPKYNLVHSTPKTSMEQVRSEKNLARFYGALLLPMPIIGGIAAAMLLPSIFNIPQIIFGSMIVSYISYAVWLKSKYSHLPTWQLIAFPFMGAAIMIAEVILWIAIILHK